MAVKDQIVRIADAKADIKEVVNNDGTIINDETIDKYADLIGERIVTAQNTIKTATSEDGVCNNVLVIPELPKVEIDGNSKQDTTTGYQLFDINTATISGKENIASDVKTKTGFTITSNSSATTSDFSRILINTADLFDSSKSYVFSCDVTLSVAGKYIIGWYSTGTPESATINANTKTHVIVKVVNKVGTYLTLGAFIPNCTITVENMQLVEGTEDKDYEPYTGGIASPNPDYPQEIEVVRGKNLAYLYKENYYYQFYNGKLIVNANFNTYKADVKPNTTYISSFTGDYGDISNLVFWDKDFAYISGLAYNGEDKTFTTPDNCYYVTIAVNKKNLNFMVELGSTSTTYLPYNTIALNHTGKNLWNVQKIVTDSNNSETYITTDGEWLRIKTSGDRMYFYPNGIKENTQYTLKCTIKNDTAISNITTITALYTDGTSSTLVTTGSIADTNEHTLTGTTTSGKTLSYLRTGYTDSKVSYIKIDGTQLEEGTLATTYEKYVTPETIQIDLQGNYLAKVGDVRDVLSISKYGKVEKEDNILHIASYNGESITTDYMSTTGQLTTGAEIYYVNPTPTTEELDTIEPIQMWEGTNYFTLDANMDTDFDINYYLKYNID